MLANKATLDFIRRHADDDVRRLALRGGRDPEVDLAYALEQIAGRRAARTKLPAWAATEGIVYPPHLAMEQCSSEATARYKAALAGGGTLFVDLTAGFGVDMAYIAQGFERAVHVEQQPSLCAISSANFETLGLRHIEVLCGDGVEYLHVLTHADLILVDPARRDTHGARTYALADCTPNVLETIDEMVEKADRVLLKLSPMLDWQQAVRDIGNAGRRAAFVNEVHIVSVGNECKELLLLVSGHEAPLKIACANDGEVFAYEAAARPAAGGGPAGEPSSWRFLYEPNASVMKAGCFGLIAGRFDVAQIAGSSHLFVSAAAVEGFPGRGFTVERVTTMNRRELREALHGITKANIAVRNFPLPVAELRRRLKLQDGGDVYIFATTTANQTHLLLICRKNQQ